MNYNLDWLLAKHAADEPLKYLLFWGHRPEKDGGVGKGCFSQWWPSAFVVEGDIYASAEHWMMAEKARLFGDDDTRTKILLAKTPAEAKKLGREVGGFVPETWQTACFDIVVGIGLAQDDPAALEPTRWKGTNLLGFALMAVRDQLASP